MPYLCSHADCRSSLGDPVRLNKRNTVLSLIICSFSRRLVFVFMSLGGRVVMSFAIDLFRSDIPPPTPPLASEAASVCACRKDNNSFLTYDRYQQWSMWRFLYLMIEIINTWQCDEMTQGRYYSVQVILSLGCSVISVRFIICVVIFLSLCLIGCSLRFTCRRWIF
jgi:hypothetical protein